MSKAILTIDDSPTRITPDLVDYLCSKNIVPELNFMGIKVQEYFDEAVYAVKKGAIIGNHSYAHPHFSEITLEECREEIAKTETEIDRVYRAADVKREYRIFRFPYGDKGGENAEALQKMLSDEFHFDQLDTSCINYSFWKKYHVDADRDMMWTFDFLEYKLSWNIGYTWESIVERMNDKNPSQGGYLFGDENHTNIILMHDMEETNAVLDNYYEKLIDYVSSCGVKFVKPRFLACPK